MNVQYLAHTCINKPEWDALITQSPQRQVYALSWYLDVVAPDWDAVVMLDEQGKYKAVMPVPWRKKLGIRYVQQPLFCQQLGIYTSAESINEAIFRQFLAVLHHKYLYIISLGFNTDNTVLLQLGQEGVSRNYTLYLDLTVGYEQLYRSYTRDRKMNLKRAQKAQLQIIESNNLEPLISFFKEETANRIYGGVAEDAYEQLRQLYQQLTQRGLCSLLYTSDAAGLKNAGCLFIIWQGKIIYIYNAAAGFGRKLNGRTLLLDHIIRKYSGQPYVLDFESPDDAEPDIVHFYKSFGTYEAAIPLLHYNHLPKSIKWVREVRMRLVRTLRGLPNP